MNTKMISKKTISVSKGMLICCLASLMCFVNAYGQDVVSRNRVCSVCKQSKPVSAFTGDSQKCKVCVNKPTTGKLSISSSPSGASVKVDGTYKGTTPLTLEKLRPGSYQVTISAEGYGAQTLSEYVIAGKTTTCYMPLKTSTGTLIVTSTPSKVKVKINDTFKGTTPLTLKNLKPGTYKVTIGAERFNAKTNNVKVKAGETIKCDANVGTNVGKLNITSSPSGPTVKVDNIVKGTTPLTIEKYPGTYQITISADGYKSQTIRETVTEGIIKKCDISLKSATGTEAGHKWVDLGLSVRWATTNVGARSESDYGDYFAWGETAPKREYSAKTYKHCKGKMNKLTKYCMNKKFGNVDYKKQLELIDDAAHVNWGGKWRIPTKVEWNELITKCKMEYTTRKNHKGYLVTGPNGSSIFLPAAGSHRFAGGRSDIFDEGKHSYYWSSSRYDGDEWLYEDHSYSFWGISDELWQENRESGLSVRPVFTP